MFKHILFSSILVNNIVIVTENEQKIFQLQLQLLNFEIFQLQLHQNCVIDFNFVNFNYNFSRPGTDPIVQLKLPSLLLSAQKRRYRADEIILFLGTKFVMSKETKTKKSLIDCVWLNSNSGPLKKSCGNFFCNSYSSAFISVTCGWSGKISSLAGSGPQAVV